MRALALAPLLLFACTLARPLDYLTDGVHGPDASTDAAINGGPCLGQSPAPFFCADFDVGDGTTAFREGVAFSLPPVVVDPGASSALTPDGRSAPHALSLATGPVDVGAKSAARMEKPVEQGPSAGARLSFALRIDEIGSIYKASVATIQLRGPGGGDTVAIYLAFRQDGTMTLTVSSAGAGAPASAPIPAAGTWTNVDLDVVLGTTITARLIVDGTVRGETSGPAPFARAAASDFYLGPSTTGPAAPLRIAIDDVVFTAP